MSQPNPRGNMMTFLWLGLAIFLGINLWQSSQQKPDPRPSSELLTVLRQNNGAILDLSIVRNRSLLDAKVDEEVRGGKLSPADGERRKLEAMILVANTQYRAGVLRHDHGRLNAAYQTLQGAARSRAMDKAWLEEEFELTPHRQFEDNRVTGKELYDEVVAELSRRSRTDKIMGVFPGYQMIDALVQITGANPHFSYAFAAFLLALVVRLIIFPLAQKQYIFGREMAQLMPLINDLKAQYTDPKTKQIRDPQELQLKTMELYKQYGLSPLAGCLPALIQVPFFLLIYQCMVHYQFDFQKGYFLWINPGTSAGTNGFLAPNLGEKDYLLIAVYAVSMVVTAFLTPVSDPSNAKQQRMMGIGISVLFSVIMFFYPLPSAFVLYWVFLNILATLHMLYAYRIDLPPLEKVGTPTGGAIPFNPKSGSSSQGPAVKKGTPVRHRPKKKK